MRADEWDESKHPRGEGGKFGSGGGGADPKAPQAKGTEYRGSGNLKKQGFSPMKRARGSNPTEVMQVAWGHAMKTGKSVTVAQTHNGFALLGEDQKLAHGQSHLVVTPEGDVHQFHFAKADSILADMVADAAARLDQLSARMRRHA